jgi:antitoxin (DNA-binding transcriptional repressor) of toxin-antitoxin stability system
MKKEVNTHEVKTHLSRLLKRVAAGEEITISEPRKPSGSLDPDPAEGIEPAFGMFRRKFVVPEDFDAPLPDELVVEGREKRIRKRAARLLLDTSVILWSVTEEYRLSSRYLNRCVQRRHSYICRQ